MRRLIPDTITGRTFLAMVLALLVSNALGIFVYVTEHRSIVNLIGGEHVADHIVTLVHLIDIAPEEEQEEMVAFADETFLHVTRTPAPAVHETASYDWQEEALRLSFQRQLVRHGKREFRLRFTDAPPEATDHVTYAKVRQLSDNPKDLQLSVRLKDGAWLNFTALITHPVSIWSFRFILSMLIMTMLVISVTAIIIYRISVPLHSFARAAKRLGVNIDTPPLPLRGPREIREVISAFNEMQQRIRRLLEDRRQILAAVSHDLRTPITLLHLRAERVEDRENKERMISTLDEMESMVGSILTFARDDAVDEEICLVDLAALVRAICDDMTDVGELVTFTGPDRRVYECRRVSLKRAIINIIENAVKYGRRAEVSMRETPNNVVIEIDDEGPGIPEAELERVVSPFYRVERSRSPATGGIGLGLTVAKSIIALHGGELTLQNRPQGGLRVTVVLPRQSCHEAAE